MKLLKKFLFPVLFCLLILPACRESEPLPNKEGCVYEPLEVITRGLTLFPGRYELEAIASIPSDGVRFELVTTGKHEKDGFLHGATVDDTLPAVSKAEDGQLFDMDICGDWGKIIGYNIGEVYNSPYKVEGVIEKNPSSQPRNIVIYLSGNCSELVIEITQEGSPK